MALSKITNASVADDAVHGRRNLIINGAMQISQLGTDIDNIIHDTAYNMDRFRTRNYGGNGTYDYDQSSDVPNSTFNKSLKLTCKSAATDVGTFGYSLEQIIEGYNIAQLHLGRSTAKPITVSFWVKSSIAGTYSTGLRTTAGEFSFTTEFTLSANTWTYVTYTAPALTTTLSSLNEDTGVGLHVDVIGFGAQTSKIASTLDAWEAGNKVFSSNQTAWMSNAGATLNVTGVQLEVGDASPFEHRSYGEELALCQRYTYVFNSEKLGGEKSISSMSKWSNGYTYGAYNFPCTMRTAPSGTAYNTGQFTIYIGGGAGAPNTEVNIENVSPVSCEMNVQTSLGSTGQSGFFRKTGSNTGSSAGYIVFDAEL